MIDAPFTCNICGGEGRFNPVGDWREAASCIHCRSSVRMRSIIHCFTTEVLKENVALNQVQSKNISGVGLSDWEGYASHLREKFNYQNSYFHQEPRLDICRPTEKWINSCDFLISTDVFEHVLPPSKTAFEGSYSILKPGGVIVMTAPYGDNKETLEHYPDVVDFATVKLGDNYIVVIQSDKGTYYLDEKPVFHGGPGTTLEMRIFSHSDIVAQLEAAGFIDIKLHNTAVPEWGIFPPHHFGLPITARKPL